jgi:hypothetical protein
MHTAVALEQPVLPPQLGGGVPQLRVIDIAAPERFERALELTRFTDARKTEVMGDCHDAFPVVKAAIVAQTVL